MTEQEIYEELANIQFWPQSVPEHFYYLEVAQRGAWLPSYPHIDWVPVAGPFCRLSEAMMLKDRIVPDELPSRIVLKPETETVVCDHGLLLTLLG